MESLACAPLGGRIRRNGVHVVHRVLGHGAQSGPRHEDGTALNMIQAELRLGHYVGREYPTANEVTSQAASSQ